MHLFALDVDGMEIRLQMQMTPIVSSPCWFLAVSLEQSHKPLGSLHYTPITGLFSPHKQAVCNPLTIHRLSVGRYVQTWLTCRETWRKRGKSKTCTDMWGIKSGCMDWRGYMRHSVCLNCQTYRFKKRQVFFMWLLVICLMSSIVSPLLVKLW